jgi:hypothetical protein
MGELSFVAIARHLIAGPTLAAALFSMHFLRISGASSPVLVNR